MQPLNIGGNNAVDPCNTAGGTTSVIKMAGQTGYNLLTLIFRFKGQRVDEVCTCLMVVFVVRQVSGPHKRTDSAVELNRIQLGLNQVR